MPVLIERMGQMMILAIADRFGFVQQDVQREATPASAVLCQTFFLEYADFSL